jgi:hypothetical protein
MRSEYNKAALSESVIDATVRKREIAAKRDAESVGCGPAALSG